MKHFLFLVLVTALFSSCYKFTDVNAPGTASGGGGSFTAKINGESFTANRFATATVDPTGIVIAGKSSNGRQIILALENRGVNTYQLHDTAMDVAAYTDSVFSQFAFATNQYADNMNHGSVTITSINTTRKTISGRFTADVKMQFTGATRTITEGVFTDISYAPAATGGGGTGSGSDTLRLTNNGTMHQTNMPIINSQAGYIAVQAPLGGLQHSILMPNTITVSSQEFGFAFPPTYQITPGISSLIISNAGTGCNLTILEHNTTTRRIRGNFSGVLKEAVNPTPATTYTVTNGYFSVKY